MATPREFYRELTTLTKFEIVGTPKEDERQIRIVGRVRGRAVSRTWATRYVEALVRASTGNPKWGVDVSRYYFEQNNEVIWAWRIIIQAAGIPMESALDEILRTLRLSGRPVEAHPTVELEEVPLIAARQTRNVLVKGKGASMTREAGR